MTTKYVVAKQGAKLMAVYAQVQPNGDVFWKAGINNATELNLTKARQIAHNEKGWLMTKRGNSFSFAKKGNDAERKD